MNPLIQPARKGRELVEQIASTRPDPGSLAIWWLGQSGFLIKSRKGSILIDPYLSEHLTRKYEGTARPHVRMTEAPLRGSDLDSLDLVLASHKHSDHMDPGTLPDVLAASPDAMLLVPCSQVDHAMSLGINHDRIWALEAGDTYASAGFLIRAIPSAHESLDTDAGGRHFYLGFVIESEGLRLYHSGDSVAYDGLGAWLGPDPFDVMFLPINGRDPSRGVPGNMTAAEAVDLASSVRPRFVVPHHYDMFEFNTIPVAEFEREALRLPEGVAAKMLRCGERWDLRSPLPA